MDKRLEDTLKKLGGIRLKVTYDPIQRLHNEPHACVVSSAYSRELIPKDLTEKVAKQQYFLAPEVLVVDGTKQYYTLRLKPDRDCSMDQIVVYRGLLLQENDIVYVFPETALHQLQKAIPVLLDYGRL